MLYFYPTGQLTELSSLSLSLSKNLIYPTRVSLFPIICILRLTAPLLLTRNPWIGGCHGFLGHMRGFPVARRSRRCLDQKKSRAIFH